MVGPMEIEPEPARLPYSRVAINDNALCLICRYDYLQISAVGKGGSALGSQHVFSWID